VSLPDPPLAGRVPFLRRGKRADGVGLPGS